VLNQTKEQCDEETRTLVNSISVIDSTLKQNMNEMNITFMYTHILKEIIEQMEFHQESVNDFAEYCRKKFSEDSNKRQIIEKFEQEYFHHEPLWWYTNQWLLCSLLNRAVCTMELDMIIQMTLKTRTTKN
jgi:hypothetical protein